VAELRRAEAELARAHDRYRDLYEFAPVGYLTVDRRRVIREANLTAAGMLGVEPDRLQGDRLDRFVEEDRRGDLCRSFREARAVRAREAFEAPFRRPDGSRFCGRLEIAPRGAGESAGAAGFRVILTDASERKRAQEELEALNRTLEERVEQRTAELERSRADAVFRCESIPHVVHAVLPDGTVSYCNRRGLEYLGRRIEELQDLRWADGVHPEDLEAARAAWTLALETGTEQKAEFRLRRAADGMYRWHAGHMVPQHDDRGRLVMFLGTCTDIHERKEAEASLRQREADLIASRQAEENKNIALGEVIAQIGVEKNRIRAEVAASVRENVMPLLDRLAVAEGDASQIRLLRKSLEDLAGPSGGGFLDAAMVLSPKEKEICRMVKGGLSSKEIAGMLNLSPQTVEKHRKNIRKKLGIASRRVNLGSYLDTL